jgi:peroxiredoxin family protein
VLLCHGGGWDRLYQAFSAAAAAAAAGRSVTVVLYFQALDRVLGAGLDHLELDPPHPGREAALAERAELAGIPALSSLLTTARRTGRVKVLACSASMALGGHDAATSRAVIDEVVGWPTVLRLMDQAGHVLYL